MLQRIWNIVKSWIFGAGESFIDANLVSEVEQEIRELQEVLEKSRSNYHEIQGKIEYLEEHEIPDLQNLLKDYTEHAKALKSENPEHPDLKEVATLAVSVKSEIEAKTMELNSYKEITSELNNDISELNSQITSLNTDLNSEKIRAKVSKTKAAVASTVRSDLTNAKSKLKQIKEKNVISSAASDSKLKKDVKYQMKKSSSANNVTDFLDGL